MKKKLGILLSLVLLLGFVAACSGQSTTPATTATTTPSAPATSTPAPAFDGGKEITVISREASSGTRGAFDELMKIKVKEGDTEVDKLFEEAVISDSTDAVATKVEVDKYAIGYTSLGSLNDRIKALAINGVAATMENVKSGDYTIARPFIFATKGEAEGIAADFLKFAASKQGQAIVTAKGFITAVDDAEEYVLPATAMNGTLSLGGSTSVEKVVEVLKEEYIKLNPNVKITVQYNGSGTGIKDCIAGTVEVAMSSRDLSATEKENLLPFTFAHDGIAVIVNAANPLTDLTSAKVTEIFTGTVRVWQLTIDN